MKFMKKFKRKGSLGLVLLLLICVSPFQSFAQEETQQTSSSNIGVSVAFQVELKLEGDKPENVGLFTFVLEPEKETYPIPDATEVTIEGEGSAYFGDITFTQPGDYVYYIRQKVDEPLVNYVYDDRVYVLRVNVSPDNSVNYYRVSTNNILQATFSVNQEGKDEKTGDVIFSNAYVKPSLATTETTTEATTDMTTETTATEETTTPAETTMPAETTTPTATTTLAETTTSVETTTTVATTTPAVTNNTPGSTGRSVPRTGDNTNVVFLWVMLICAAAGMSVGIWCRFRTGKHGSK
jgi:hypothetical protein